MAFTSELKQSLLIISKHRSDLSLLLCDAWKADKPGSGLAQHAARQSLKGESNSFESPNTNSHQRENQFCLVLPSGGK